MNKDPKFTTVLFNNVSDTDKFVSTIETHVPYPIIKKNVQNDGVVVFVFKDLPFSESEDYMRDFVNTFGFTEVNVATTMGNAIE